MGYYLRPLRGWSIGNAISKLLRVFTTLHENQIVKPKTFMLIAGEASGDLLAAELVSALHEKLPDAKFFGAGGAKMSAAGVELAFDLTQHSVIGISDVLKNYFKFRRLFNQLLALAIERKPDVVIGVDYGGFNLRFGHAVKEYVRNNPFSQWNPKIVQFVSPQVWASRPGRADLLARDYDLLLSIFPFEKDWYAKRVPKLRVEFVGHPMIGRFTNDDLRFTRGEPETASIVNRKSQILLLPGSRKSELQRHLLVILSALKLIQEKLPNAKAKLVLPNENLARTVSMELDLLKKLESAFDPKEIFRNLEIQVGNLPDALAQTDVAIASTGTVTMECAFFGVPTVTLYKTSALTYQIAKRIVTVKSLTMPNLLASEEVYPEFVQNAATPENISRAALELLQDEPRRVKIKSQLAKIISSLGELGAAGRAAEAILSLFP
jgi:lipid-A-disaccharide synthase